MSDQILKLTAVIEATESPEVFVGYIKEIEGIQTQGSTREEVFDDLVTITGTMLEYKQPEALALLAKQNHHVVAASRGSRVGYRVVEKAKMAA